jgi:hypothetical protein
MQTKALNSNPVQNNRSFVGKLQFRAGLDLDASGVFPLDIKEKETKNNCGQQPAGDRNQNPG